MMRGLTWLVVAAKMKGIVLVILSVSARIELQWNVREALETYKVDFRLSSLLNLERKGDLQSCILISEQ